MQQILWKTVFITMLFFISFTLVASNGNTHQKLLTNITQFNNCPSLDLSSCTNTLPPSTLFTPNPQLNEQERFLSAIAHNLPIIPQPGTFEYILLRAYGAVFVKQEPEIKLPSKVILDNEQETQEFQSTLAMTKVNNTHDCYLQQPAAAAFNQAQIQAIIPLKSGYGSGDCTRTFATNLRFWHKYANNQTLEKVRQGKETKILGLVAPPGTSQHLWGLAIDLRITNQKQREALNQNGWFQTVENDLPHWTYISLSKDNLSLFGFKKKVVRGITYWITPL
ncbi:D-alanyl-D-alanine carboxypeptidase family protein [Calothrix sp. PCC 7507]|uniref:D-alanyl-D-alanine carboxypeptidase family protein n=1 Tax=Calothrix sp. PCC 7507 TaxID=99598 RepID=UPI00029ED513|nr:D-alanyl-D-alanine carboxypeptidase family protein [Calothrix sp. PCC 7507]AFY36160.1 peptidase M15B and M15C DD-carboxypeptidase VanY/endolysin [Calothrix sp. PCC 7507]